MECFFYFTLVESSWQTHEIPENPRANRLVMGSSPEVTTQTRLIAN